MDVPKATIAVSVAAANGGEVRYVGEIANTPEAIEKLVRQLRKGDAHLSFCYEAGPCGYGIHRQLSDLGWDCQVVAPSLIPRKAGERVGARQGTCRLSHAAKGCLSVACEAIVTTDSRSGLRVTAPIGVQSRVQPDQRAGLRSRAWTYTSCRAA